MEQNPAQPLKVPGDNLSPDARTVEAFHRKADTDTKHEAAHHTLGTGENQASPGSHNHDGTTSRLILDGFAITGDRSDGTALVSVIQALVQLGATDSTVA